MPKNLSEQIVALQDALEKAGALDTAVAEAGEPVQVEAFRKSGLSVEDYAAKLRTGKPHWWGEAEGEKKPADSAQIKMERAAFGKSGTLAAQGELVKKIGAAKAAEVATAWGTKLGTLDRTGGRNPHKLRSAADDANGKKPRPAATGSEARTGAAKEDNPKSKNPFKSGDVAAIAALIGRIGTDEARRMAANAGTDLAGRPLRKSA